MQTQDPEKPANAAGNIDALPLETETTQKAQRIPKTGEEPP